MCEELSGTDAAAQRGGFPLWGVLIFSAVILLVVAVGWTLFWTAAAGGARERIDLAIKDAQAAGWRIESRRPAASGYPFRILLNIDGVDVVGPEGELWRTDRVSLRLRPWRLNRADILFSGRHVLRAAGPTAQPFDFAARKARAQITLDAAGAPAQADIRLDDAALFFASGQAASATIARLSLDRVVAERPTATLTAREIVLTPALTTPIGPVLPHIALSGRVRAADRLGAGPAAWRAAGGRLEIARLVLETPGFVLEGAGALSLDADRVPVGALETTIDRPNGLIDALSRHGAADAEAAAMAKAALAFLGAGARIPVRAAGGALFIGPAPVSRLPQIPDWTTLANPPMTGYDDDRYSPPGAEMAEPIESTPNDDR